MRRVRSAGARSTWRRRGPKVSAEPISRARRLWRWGLHWRWRRVRLRARVSLGQRFMAGRRRLRIARLRRLRRRRRGPRMRGTRGRWLRCMGWLRRRRFLAIRLRRSLLRLLSRWILGGRWRLMGLRLRRCPVRLRLRRRRRRRSRSRGRRGASAFGIRLGSGRDIQGRCPWKPRRGTGPGRRQRELRAPSELPRRRSWGEAIRLTPRHPSGPSGDPPTS